MAVAGDVPPTGDVKPAVAQATAVLEEQLVELGVAHNPLEPVACHRFRGY